MASIYVRKAVDGVWKHIRVEEGRGKKTGDFAPPFYIRPVVNGKQTWRTLDAQNFKDAKEEEAANVNAPSLDPNRLPVKTAVERYLQSMARSKKPKTVQNYTHHLKQFLESLPNDIRYVDQIDGETIAGFRDWLQDHNYCAKTQHNRLVTILSLLKRNDAKTSFSLADDLPKVEEEPAVPFEPDQLKKLFAAMDEEERVRYKFFLGTAAREKEVTFAAWADVDFGAEVYHIRRKPDVGFTPKSHESRKVKMPSDLVELLKVRRAAHPSTRWIFLNEEGRPDKHFLRKFKRIALHAGVNCGHCTTSVTKGKYHTTKVVEVSCKTDPVCEHIFLHRLRKTCATRWHEAGVPIRTIQYMLGHKSLETTMGYLGITGLDKIGGNIDLAFANAMGD